MLVFSPRWTCGDPDGALNPSIETVIRSHSEGEARLLT
jgi:hypothetical protein